jgi:hypothetical protein
MKKLFLTFLVLLATSISVFSQRLVWEKTIDYRANTTPQFGSSNDDYIRNIHQIESGDFIYVARTDTFGLVYRPLGGLTLAPNVLLRKVNQLGEFTSNNISIYDTIASDIASWYNPNSSYLSVLYIKGGGTGDMSLRRFNRNLIFAGEYNFSLRDFPERIYPSYNFVLPATDGGFFIVGIKQITINNQRQQLWGVAKLSATAEYEWGQTYSSNFVNNEVNHVEYTANGNLLLSGWEGGQPVAKEIDDSTGNLVRTINFGRVITRGFAKVQVYQAPNNQFYINGQENFASGQPFRTYLGKYDSTGQKIWGSLSNDSRLFLKVFTDGSTWSIGTLTGRNGLYYKKNLADSTLAFALLISNDTTQTNTGYKIFNDAIFLGDGSAIFGGKITEDRTGTYFGEAMYLCKIDNIGRPFVTGGGPQLVLSNQEKEPEIEPNLQVYPNPFTNTLRLSHKGTAQLLDVHGRVIISQPVEAGEELKVGNLPKGIYLLRLQSVGGKLYVRKVVRE